MGSDDRQPAEARAFFFAVGQYDAEQERDRLRAFVAAYDRWAQSPEHCGGDRFEAMLDARAALDD